MEVLNINQSGNLPHRNQPRESVNYFHMKHTICFFLIPQNSWKQQEPSLPSLKSAGKAATPLQ